VIVQRFHRGFTAAEKTELWDRWQRGESLKAIGRALSKPSSSIYFQLAPHGGIRPAPRRRSRLALTLSEREEISRGIAAAQSARSMARLLGRSPSTVSRELSRNGGYDRYRAALADETAWARARRPKRCKLAMAQAWRNIASPGAVRRSAHWRRRRSSPSSSRMSRAYRKASCERADNAERSRSKSVTPLASVATILPSIVTELTGVARRGVGDVRQPLGLIIAAPSQQAHAIAVPPRMSRQPSCLISCTHSSPTLLGYPQTQLRNVGISICRI
jgi:DNA-binding CsgD family transcriptional regulator